jgi:hypothetical protein
MEYRMEAFSGLVLVALHTAMINPFWAIATSYSSIHGILSILLGLEFDGRSGYRYVEQVLRVLGFSNMDQAGALGRGKMLPRQQRFFRY